MCLVTDAACDKACLEAIAKTAERLGYGHDDLAHVVIDTQACCLSQDSLFELIEGLDPVCVCVVGQEAVSLFCQAYRLQVQSCVQTTALGRPVCLLADMATLLTSEDGRQKAWALLKMLPNFPA